jgi:hypothetical protein
MQIEVLGTAIEERYYVQQFERKSWNYREKKDETGTLWGVWKRGTNPTKDNPRDDFDTEEEARLRASEWAKEDVDREAEERRVAEEEAEDDRKAANLAAEGIAIPRHNPKVERLCKMIVKGNGIINYDHRKRALEIAKQLLIPVKPKDGDDNDALIAQYDPGRDTPEGRPTYRILLTVTGSRLEATLKKARITFGSLLLNVDKVARLQSRADELGDAVGMISEARSIVESLKEQIEEWHDNLPDSFRDGDKGSQLEECTEALEQVAASTRPRPMRRMSIFRGCTEKRFIWVATVADHKGHMETEVMEMEFKCSPALAKPGTKCTATCTTEDGEPCRHPVVMICDCGNWCSCAGCITCCPESWEEYMLLGEPESPGCGGDCCQENGTPAGLRDV